MAKPRYAISSHIAQSPYQAWKWPAVGEAHRAAVVEGMPVGPELVVLPLPTDHGESLHFQSVAFWVVLEIDELDYVEVDGKVSFVRGRVIFNGPCQRAVEFLRAKGLAIPRSLNLVSVDAWSEIVGPAHSCVVAGQYSTGTVGDHGIAVVASGAASGGRSALVVSPYAEVETGDFGIAVSRYGRHAVAGTGGLAWSHEGGMSKAGARGVAVVDAMGQAIVGEDGFAVARNGAEAHVDPGAIAVVDEGGTAIGATGSLLAFIYRDPKGNRRVVSGRIGDAGLAPATRYKCSDTGKIIPAE